MSNYEDIGEFGRDVVREIGSIGTGNAATAISGILSTEVKIELPEIKVMGFSEAVKELGDPEDTVIAVFSEMSGDIDGAMMLITRLDFARDTLKIMMGKEISDYDDIDEISFSAISELGNMVISSYVSALAGLTGMDVSLSVPAAGLNMLGAVLNIPMAVAGYDTNKLLMTTGKFMIGSQQHESCLLMVPSVKSLVNLLRKLGAPI